MVGPAAAVGGQDRDGASNRRSALYTLCLFEAFPSRGNEKYGEEKQRVIYFMCHSGGFPLWWLVPYGQAPLGLEGSGAFRRPGSIVRVLRTERWVRPTERAGSEGSFICRCLGQRKPLQPPCGRGNAFPLWWLAPPPFPRKRGHYGCLAMRPCLYRKA